MKPIQLEIEAFGSFAEKQAIDFEIFEKSRLFLIHGPTGSGKTTLFDAICYSLYGETTGERKGISMRSDHVAKDIRTKVIFVFQVGMHSYRIEREMYVAKNEEVKEKQSFCQVAKDPESGEFKASSSPLVKKGEILHQVRGLLGFDASQFKQIVILPQGKFQELLTSDTKTKEEILTQLFNASIYQKISDHLGEQSKKFRKEIEQVEQKIQARLEASQQESSQTLQAEIETKIEELRALNRETMALDQRYKDSLRHLQEAQQKQELFKEFNLAQTEIDTLEKDRPLQEKRLGELKKAEAAESFRTPLEELKTVLTNIEATERQIVTEKSIIISKEERLNKIKDRWMELEAEEESMEDKKRQLKEWENLGPTFEKKEALQKLINEKEASYQKLKNTLEQNEKKLKELKNTLEQSLEPKVESLRALSQGKDRQSQGLKQFEQWAQLRSKLHSFREQYKKMRSLIQKEEVGLQKLRDSRVEKSQIYEALDDQWRKHQSAYLASQLKENEPCSVCGSTSHPNPAKAKGKLGTEAELNQAKEARNKAQKDYEKQQEEYQNTQKDFALLESEGKQLAEQLGEVKDLSEEEFQAQYKQVEQALEKIKAADAELTKLQKQIPEFRKKIQQVEKDIQDERPLLSERFQGLTELKSEYKYLLEQLPSEIENQAQLKKACLKLQEKIDQFENEKKSLGEEREKLSDTMKQRRSVIITKEKDLKNLLSDQEDREKKLDRDLKKRAFKSMEEMSQALREDFQRDKLKKLIQAWQEEFTRKHSHWEKLSQKLKGQENPELRSLNQKKASDEENLRQHREKITRLDSQIKSQQEQLKKIQKLEKERKGLEEEAQHVFQMYSLANGNNELNQKFQTYVLSVFLDEVVSYANQRLSALSQQRYELQRSEEVEHGLRKSGLDLKVFDSYSGKERPVKNLSGGETFFTSLALALGLADVATANAGGLHLDAMFIDEGFGTLDSETLDSAIQTLMDLDGEYRLVGIISHVAELKERIPASRLEVIKEKRGSKIKVHVL